MVTIFLSLLLITGFYAAIAQQGKSNITLGSSPLSPNTNPYLLSDSGQFAFGFYQEDDGFAVGIWLEKIRQKTVVWTWNPRDSPRFSNDVKLLLTNDGRFVLQNEQSLRIDIAGAELIASSASMLDTGNFVLYNSSSAIIWQTFNAPTDTLLPGQRLLMEGGIMMNMFSSMSKTNHARGKFELAMQSDGNLVQFPFDSLHRIEDDYWNTNTYGAGENVSLNLARNGQLFLLNSTGFIIKDLYIAPRDPSNNFPLYRLTLDFDGILRLYSHSLNQVDNWTTVWSPPNVGKCNPLGLCGLNGYCTLQELKTVCKCLPGFDFLDPRQHNLGCKRNTRTVGCTSINREIVDTIEELNSVDWDDSPYSTLDLNKSNCMENCLKDCECEAAIYKNDQNDQKCRKQKLPLKYGRVREDKLYITIIKVRSGSPDTTPVSRERKKQLGIGILLGSLALLIVLSISVFLIVRYRRLFYKKNINEVNDGLIEDVSVRAFTYTQLEVATNGFVEELGRGSFGTVFKGSLLNGQKKIAVKRLEKVASEGELEFHNEMRSIGRIHHRNLVQLLGYCHDGSNRLLVYEYMSNGTLSDYIFRSQIKPNWEERIKISLNIARGILYLHEECETHIIHCDLNPNNILIDEHGCAKIADFGLAKILMPDHSKTLTGIRGTRGYVAPEWHKNLPITVKADVYSFGVVFLVIICCRKSVDINVPEQEIVLVNWVYDCFKANEVSKLVPKDVDEQSLKMMIQIALWCIEDNPEARPPIKKVIQMLEGIVDIPEPPCARSSF